VDFGVNVNTWCPIIYPERYSAPRLVDLAEQVERLGDDTVFVGDNYFSKPRLGSPATLAAIAARTKRVVPRVKILWVCTLPDRLDSLAGPEVVCVRFPGFHRAVGSGCSGGRRFVGPWRRAGGGAPRNSAEEGRP